MENKKFTPNKITKLESNEVFVFGSNESGIHGAGAAKTALNNFGAVYGQGVGLYGKSYAIPTKDRDIKTLPIETIKNYVNDFIIFAIKNNDKTFYVTEIGCGLAGLKHEQIAPLFKESIRYSNIILPESFYNIIMKDFTLKAYKVFGSHF